MSVQTKNLIESRRRKTHVGIQFGPNGWWRAITRQPEHAHVLMGWFNEPALTPIPGERRQCTPGSVEGACAGGNGSLTHGADRRGRLQAYAMPGATGHSDDLTIA